MSILRLVVREIRHRTGDFLFALVAVVTAVAFFVGIMTLSAVARAEISRRMSEMARDVVILPAGTDVALFWSDNQIADDMDEQDFVRLADAEGLPLVRLQARLQQRLQWRGLPVLLTGVLSAGDGESGPTAVQPSEGQAFLGWAIADGSSVASGDGIEISDHPLTVAKVMPRAGSVDDIRIYTHLCDAQEILDRSGRINLIRAVGAEGAGDVRPRISRVLPEAVVELDATRSRVRREAADNIRRWAAVLIPIVTLACAVWVGHLTLVNVRDRRREIGTLRALGVSSGKVAALFILRVVLLGGAGAVVGFVLGTWLALRAGGRMFPLTAPACGPLYGLLAWSVIGAPLLCALAGWLPTLIAVRQDPADILREE